MKYDPEIANYVPPPIVSTLMTVAPLKAYTLTAQSRNVHTLTFENVRAGWEQWILLTSDRHHDNIHSRWDLERKHLEEARYRRAFVIDVGDAFCAMQGKYDPRSSMDDLRPEHKVTNYLDALVQTAADFYGPYADLFAVIGRGNHDTNIATRHGTDLISNLVYALNTRHGGQCFAGGYGGWVRLQFVIQTTVRQTLLLKYFHGGGGGGPVTRGVIDTNRQAVYLPDADIVVNGHTHDMYVVPIKRERLTAAGTVEHDIVWYLRTSTYKDEYGDGFGGWHVEKKGAPKPLGCIWGRLFYEDGKVRVHFTQDAV